MHSSDQKNKSVGNMYLWVGAMALFVVAIGFLCLLMYLKSKSYHTHGIILDNAQETNNVESSATKNEILDKAIKSRLRSLIYCYLQKEDDVLFSNKKITSNSINYKYCDYHDIIVSRNEGTTSISLMFEEPKKEQPQIIDLSGSGSKSKTIYLKVFPVLKYNAKYASTIKPEKRIEQCLLFLRDGHLTTNLLEEVFGRFYDLYKNKDEALSDLAKSAKKLKDNTHPFKISSDFLSCTIVVNDENEQVHILYKDVIGIEYIRRELKDDALDLVMINSNNARSVLLGFSERGAAMRFIAALEYLRDY